MFLQWIGQIIIAFAIACIALGCTPEKFDKLPERFKNLDNITVYSSDAEPDFQIQLQKVRKVGNTDANPIGTLKAVAVDNSQRIFIADAKQLNIKVYRPDGSFITQLGHKGKGPGEFSELSDIEIKGNSLFAFDDEQQRAVIFSLDSLKFDYTVNLADNRDNVDMLSGVHFGEKYVRSDGAFLMEFVKPDMAEDINNWDKIERNGIYYQLDEQGDIENNKLFEKRSSVQVLVPLPQRRVGMPVEFYGKSLMDLSSDDQIYAAWSQHFFIKVHDSDGVYKRAIYYPYDRKQLNKESVKKSGASKLLVDGMSKMNLPGQWPALHSMLVDDQNRLWVSTIAADKKGYLWWVLNKKGELIARFQPPRRKEVKTIKNGYLYTQEKNEKGVSFIVKYKINMSGK